MKKISENEAIMIQRNLLEEFHSFCINNNLRYSLAFGSLIGAVRHKDIIPWDDDIDVMMPREDFEKLCILYPKIGNKKFAAINHKANPEIKTKIVYFTDLNTISYDLRYKKEDNIQNFGIHIDVYPIDKIPSGNIRRNIFMLKRFILTSLFRGAFLYPEMRKNRINRFVVTMIKDFCSLFGRNQIIDRLCSLCSQYNNIPITKDTEGALLVEVGPALCFPYRIMEEYVKYDFGEKQYYGIKEYDIFLKLWYGDYMKPPPVEQRTSHKPPNTESFWK